MLKGLAFAVQVSRQITLHPICSSQLIMKREEA